MLIQAITHEFNNYFNQDPKHDTVLWFDPKLAWQGVLPYLTAHLPLIVYVEDDQTAQARQLQSQGTIIIHKSQLKVRHHLARRDPGTKLVIYLPMPQEQARFLRPYFYTAKCFQDTIEKVLNRNGVLLPADPKTARQIRELLPALAVASIGKGQVFWNNIVNLKTALGQLIVDWEDSLLRFLADPRRTTAHLKSQGFAQPFFEMVRLEFGEEPPIEGQESLWVERFTAMACLVELFEDSQKPDNFPFTDTLPDPIFRPRYQTFLQKWQHHELFKNAFRQLAKSIDAQYPLGTWATNLQTPPKRSTFLNVEQAIWNQSQQALVEIESKSAAIEFVRQRQSLFQERAKGFWAREGEVTGWQILSQMAKTILGADRALETLLNVSELSAVIEQYTGEWWQVDSDYRHFLTALDQSSGHLDAALKWTSRIYQDYLEQVNDHFTKLVTDQGAWPPQSGTVGATKLWGSFNKDKQGLRALILVDALRYELAQELAQRLELAPSQLSPTFSPLPSITEVGMAALLPGWPSFSVDYAGNGWQITPPNSSENLARKDKRIAWLRQHLGSAAVFELNQWLATSLNELASDYRWIVVTSSTIDAIGEGAGQIAVHTFESLLGRLEQGVRRLLAAGCVDIHIFTDHGFLLREKVFETEKVEVKEDGILKKQARYLIGRNLPPTDQPHLPVSGSQDLIAWFPRGIGCYVTTGPYNYMHGGIGLQEIVTAHIHIQQTVQEQLVGVALELVGGSEIRNAFFKVQLAPQNVDLFSKSRQVELDIVRGKDRVSRVWEEKIERVPVEKTLMLEQDYGLNLGDQVQVRVRDKTTKELLASQPAIVQVDLDF